MKTSLLLLAVVACACAAYAYPEVEERRPNPAEEVQIDLDKLSAVLSAEFADEKFLEEKFGNLAGINTQFIAGGKFGWLKKLPWGQIIDAVVGGIKKAVE